MTFPLYTYNYVTLNSQYFNYKYLTIWHNKFACFFVSDVEIFSTVFEKHIWQVKREINIIGKI